MDTISIVKFSKGHNLVKIVVELYFLFSTYPLIMFYIFTKFHENILKDFRVIKLTQFPYQNLHMGIIWLKNVDRVMVLVQCTSSDDDLY